jgi:hypothetical protein
MLTVIHLWPQGLASPSVCGSAPTAREEDLGKPGRQMCGLCALWAVDAYHLARRIYEAGIPMDCSPASLFDEDCELPAGVPWDDLFNLTLTPRPAPERLAWLKGESFQ